MNLARASAPLLTTSLFLLASAVSLAACGGATVATPDTSSGESKSETPAPGDNGSTKGERPGASAGEEEEVDTPEETPVTPAPTYVSDVPERQRPAPVTCPTGGTKSACVADDGCADGAVCGCELDRKDPKNLGNVCLTQSECVTNADCGTGNYCALSPVDGVPVGADGTGAFYAQKWGYFCTTDHDTCRNDSDCAGQSHDHICVFYKNPPSGQSGWRCGGGP